MGAPLRAQRVPARHASVARASRTRSLYPPLLSLWGDLAPDGFRTSGARTTNTIKPVFRQFLIT